jgi:regulatory protein
MKAAQNDDCGMGNAELEEGSRTAGRWPDKDDKIFVRAKNAAYRLLTFRPRSCAELRQKLQDKAFDAVIIDAVLNDLARLGYVNDRKFAEQFASSRIRLRGLGKRRVERELGNKGIERQIVSETLARIFEGDTEIETAKKAAEKKINSLKSIDRETKRRRLAGFLERRGFSYEIIRNIIETIG